MIPNAKIGLKSFNNVIVTMVTCWFLNWISQKFSSSFLGTDTAIILKTTTDFELNVNASYTVVSSWILVK